MVVGDQAADGVVEVAGLPQLPVVPDASGEREQALGDPGDEAADRVCAVAFEGELTLDRVDDEQLSNVVDETVKDHQAATLSFVVVSSSSVTLMPSLNVAPSSSSLTSSAPLSIRQRSWAASSSL